MKSGFVKSSPHFFILISRSMYTLGTALLLLAVLIPAPLQHQADPAATPNPAKSAWFLLWIQELVSWSRFMIYPVILLAALFVLLPWLPTGPRLHQASWLPRSQRKITVTAILLTVMIIILTVIAMFFRGSNWSFML